MTEQQPLAHLKIIDLSQNLPGPYLAHEFAKYGAKVTKIEGPAGDPVRGFKSFYEKLNQEKKVIPLDLKKPNDLQSLKQLLANCDIFITSTRLKSLANLGLDFSQVKLINTKIIYCHISGFAPEKTQTDRPAHDINIQAASGFFHFNNGLPSYFPLADFYTPLYAFQQIMVELYKRSLGSDEVARYINISMSESLHTPLAIWNLLKVNFDPKNKDLANLQQIPSYGIFTSSDRVCYALGIVDENHFWQDLCENLQLALVAQAQKSADQQLLEQLMKLKTLTFFERMKSFEQIRGALTKCFNLLPEKVIDNHLRPCVLPITKVHNPLDGH